MKTLSIRSGQPGVPDKKKDRLKNENLQKETNLEGEEKFDLALFQRKAYCGNYFVGPYIFLNPDLFD
jgi:hypothetical protein